MKTWVAANKGRITSKCNETLCPAQFLHMNKKFAKPCLSQRHKNAHISFGDKNLGIFSLEEKFNLNGSYYYKYWGKIGHGQLTCYKRKFKNMLCRQQNERGGICWLVGLSWRVTWWELDVPRRQRSHPCRMVYEGLLSNTQFTVTGVATKEFRRESDWRYLESTFDQDILKV